jgi:hypothetical protein
VREFEDRFKGAVIVFRTSTPGHYGCNRYDTPIDNVPVLNASNDRYNWRKPIAAELEWQNAFAQTRLADNFHYLNVSMSIYRPDAHAEFKLRNNRTSEDCLHWCLPGIPDTWNHLLYNLLMA